MAQISDAEMTLEIGEIKPQRWEHAICSLRDSTIGRMTEMLDMHGVAGWELVTIDNGLAYFKRPIWNPE